MKFRFSIFFILTLHFLPVKAEDKWSIAVGSVNGNSIVVKHIAEIPKEIQKDALKWLTVISWAYDGSKNQGMPTADVNQQMIALEDGLEKIEGQSSLYQIVYTKTGNNLKEFAFYTSDRQKFLDNMNKALEGQPAYPLQINFYEDKEWSDYEQLLSHAKVGS